MIEISTDHIVCLLAIDCATALAFNSGERKALARLFHVALPEDIH